MLVSERTIAVEQEPKTPEIEIRPFTIGEDGSPFYVLNEEWISHFFTLEPRDAEMLREPEKILRDGGEIYFAYAGSRVVGCVAIIPVTDDGVYELSKMAVSPTMRGYGVGRKMLEYALARIREEKALPVKRLFLGSSSILKNAVHLYESLGFLHIPPSSLPWVPYKRANVFMELPL